VTLKKWSHQIFLIRVRISLTVTRQSSSLHIIQGAALSEAGRRGQREGTHRHRDKADSVGMLEGFFEEFHESVECLIDGRRYS
jgi:hypothetical protein